MAKTREMIVTNEGKTNTSVKTKNGKVRKVRVNFKNCVDTKEVTTKTKSNLKDKTTSSNARLLIVKLQRTLPDSENSYNNNKTTLQAQCKAKQNKVINKNIEYKTRSRCKPQTEDNLVTTAKTKRILKEAKEKNADLQKKNCKDVSKVTAEISKLTASTEARRQNHLNLSSSSTKRCLIKLQKIKTPLLQHPVSPSSETSKISEVKLKRTPTANGRNIIFEDHSTPITLKRCVIKLQKTPTRMQTNEISVESSTRLKKRTISKRNVGNIKYTGTAPLNLPSSTPIIDNIKRNNFRKLSLTKSFRKSTETKQPENESNVYEDGEKTPKIYNKNNMEISTLISTRNDVNYSPSTKTNTNDIKSIKHIAKLSLKKPNVTRNKNITTLEITQFEPQQNSTIFFEPQRNSTLLEIGLNRKGLQENPDQELKNVTPSKDKSSSQNLANKSEEIENLLNSLDDDDCMIIENNQNANNNNKTKKFFHRNKEDAKENILKEQITKSPKTQEVKKKRRFYVKRSTITKRQNIYEFLSQSQTSDSDSAKRSDPTADVIKKLIEQGRVRVATNCKGKGKPIFKRKKPTKQMKRIKKPGERKLKKLITNTKKVTFKERKNDDECEEHQFEDHFDNDNGPEMEIERQELVSNRVKNHDNKNRMNDQEGTFSLLARRVLLNQTGRRSDLQRKNASVLLGMVKKIVSTPKNKKTPSPQTALDSNLSPIAMLNPRSASKSSPWRVNEDAYLPKTFNFYRSSGNLPSFSSDFIPSTPRKKKQNPNPNESTQTAVMSEKSPTKRIQNLVPSSPFIKSPLRDAENIHPPQTPNLSEPSVISSFSSNDSNAENMPPPRRTPEKYNENDGIFDLKQLPNPRKVLSNRSPLKQINILEVVHLPPFKLPNKSINTKDISREQIELFGFEENLDDVSFAGDQNVASLRTVQQNVSSEKTEKFPKEYPFGIEELFPQLIFSCQENIETNNNETKTNMQNQTKHDKLQEFQKINDVPFHEDHSLAAVSAVHQNDSLEKIKNLSKEFSSLEHVGTTNNNHTKTNRQNQNKHHKPQHLLKLNEVYLQRDQSVAAENDSLENIENHPKEDLFGFEEFLPQTEFSSQESIETNNNDTATNRENQTIHDKLQELRKLKPTGKELQTKLLMENSRDRFKIRPLFDDDALKEDGMRQRGIKEMLCSTMLNTEPSTSKEALRMLNNKNLKAGKRQNFAEDSDLSELFKDPDPETTFHENETLRTYVRPYKRKRRLKENKYVMFLDSDESEDEDKTYESKNSTEMAAKKKRNRKEHKDQKEKKEKKEDIAFIEEFNEMVKDVDSYELIVEKST